MPTLDYQPGGLIAGDFPVAHRSVTIASGADLARGAVVGRITASDKYALSASGASDGSQVPVGVLAEGAAASGADVVAPVYFTGEFAADQLTFGTSHTAATVEASWRQNGRALFVRTRA
jgi:hypothetical protein